MFATWSFGENISKNFLTSVHKFNIMQQMNAAPILIGDVEVLVLDEPHRILALGIAINCKPAELLLLSSKLEAQEKLTRATKYLVDEGFVTTPEEHWDIRVLAAAKQI